MENNADSNHLDGNRAYLFKTGDVFIAGAILKKALIETLGVLHQDAHIRGEENQRGNDKYGQKYRKRMSKKEQYTKVYQYHCGAGKYYQSQKRQFFIGHRISLDSNG
jgi:hypothetical protein